MTTAHIARLQRLVREVRESPGGDVTTLLDDAEAIEAVLAHIARLQADREASLAEIDRLHRELASRA